MKKSLLSILIFALCQFLIVNTWAKSAILSQWLEIGPNNQWIVRVITSDKICPEIKTNKHMIPMLVRSLPTSQFPITVCQAVLSPDITSASIKNHHFYLPKPNPQKIIIIGDTGCRIKKGADPQDCDHSRHWPFPILTRHAAEFKPDLVIHVGDYYYREAACPKGDKGCAKSPYGDDWAGWNADLFHPAKPLLEKAPWIFVRGNHETCERGGIGWTKLLDPFSFKHCFNHSPIYSVDIGGETRLFIMDSANANDIGAPPEQVSWYENYLQVVSKSPAKYNWLITHKPFWFVFKDDELTQTYQNYMPNTLQTAWLNTKLSNVNLLISGHLHRFQAINFAESRPSQIIVGDSGAGLDKNLARNDLKGLNIAGMPISQGLSLAEFGYMTLERTKDNGIWLAQVRSPHGHILARCIYKNNQFICTKRDSDREKKSRH